MKIQLRALLALVLGLGSAGCASRPAAPFDTLEKSSVSAFRLQNYDPPQPAAAAAAPAQQGMIPGLPPEIQQWAQQALPGLQQLLPPGLVPPGMLQNMQPPAAAPPPPDAPRFPQSPPNFRILGQTQIIDPDVKDRIAKLLGSEDNFQAQHASCMYAEMGLSFSPAPGAPPNDILISFSCNVVEARGFAWPHPYRGMKPKTVKELARLVQQIWPAG